MAKLQAHVIKSGIILCWIATWRHLFIMAYHLRSHVCPHFIDTAFQNFLILSTLLECEWWPVVGRKQQIISSCSSLFNLPIPIKTLLVLILPIYILIWFSLNLHLKSTEFQIGAGRWLHHKQYMYIYESSLVLHRFKSSGHLTF